MSEQDFICDVLHSIGVDRGFASSLFGSLANTPDGKRLLSCLAIDIHGGLIDTTLLTTALAACAADSTLAFTIALERVLNGTSKFIAPLPPANQGAEAYATVMGMTKFLPTFRAKPPGPSAIAAEKRFLTHVSRRNSGARLGAPRQKLQGRARPITWITLSRLIASELNSMAGDWELAAKEVIEKMGLPWPEHAIHDVVWLDYPTDIGNRVVVGQPNAFAENWSDPGIFVSNASEPGWGRTCGRVRADHNGMPERIHSTLTSLPTGEYFTVRFFASVSLPPVDRGIAQQVAAGRWIQLNPPEHRDGDH